MLYFLLSLTNLLASVKGFVERTIFGIGWMGGAMEVGTIILGPSPEKCVCTSVCVCGSSCFFWIFLFILLVKHSVVQSDDWSPFYLCKPTTYVSANMNKYLGETFLVMPK